MATLGISTPPLVLCSDSHFAKAFQTRRYPAFVWMGKRRLTADWDCLRKGKARPRSWCSIRAVQENESSSEESLSTPPIFDKKAAAAEEIQKGQRTAIITGAISVLLGVGYLVLIQVLDIRGVQLVAPPMEAYNP